MKNSIAALIVGFVFAIGLGLSGMTQPQKVIGFLDIFGNWNPSLIFVMMGAIAVHFVTFRFIMKRSSPLLSTQWHVPTKNEVTPSLVIGGAIFGVGWALGGFCPGPAVTSLATLDQTPVIFILSMLVGMALFKLVDKKLKLQK